MGKLVNKNIILKLLKGRPLIYKPDPIIIDWDKRDEYYLDYNKDKIKNMVEKDSYYSFNNSDFDLLIYDYIKSIENPNMVGYDQLTKIWRTPPADKGYDTNLLGIGLDVNTNDLVKLYLKKLEEHLVHG